MHDWFLNQNALQGCLFRPIFPGLQLRSTTVLNDIRDGIYSYNYQDLSGRYYRI